MLSLQTGAESKPQATRREQRKPALSEENYGSTGQNAFEQAKQFVKATEVTALAITKLDGTAKGGVVIGISHQMQVPVKYIGLGEKMTDLQPFNAREFVDSLFSNEK